VEVDPHPEGRIAGDLHARVLKSLTPDHALEALSCLADVDCNIAVALESMRHAQRAASRAGFLQARHAARLARNEMFQAQDAHGEVSAASEEISLALGISRVQAERLIRIGRAITGPLAETGAALYAGDITLEVAWEFVRALAPVALPVALAVESAVLPDAPGRTPSEVRAAIARALIELDPEDADDRHARARAARGVTRPQPLPDGMARISAFLPADDAVALDTALDAAAAAARAGGDCRTPGQLRADVLAGWAGSALRSGTEVALQDGSVVRSHPAKVAVTVPLEVLLRALPGFTPPPSAGEVLAGEMFGPDGTGQEESGPEGTGQEESGPEGIQGGLGTGHRTEAAVLEGYGCIAPVIALLLAAGGTWQRIVTDTLTGQPVEVGRSRYTPPADLTTLVRLRDQSCTRPGCATPAGRCDRDHVVEWARGGVTSPDNLTTLCRYHHRIKSLDLARPGPRDESGLRSWTTVTGRTYYALPARPPRARSCEPPPGEPPPGSAPDDEPPPF